MKLGVRYQNQFWPDRPYAVAGRADPYAFPQDNNNIAPRVGVAWDPARRQQDVHSRRLRHLLRQPHHRASRHHRDHRRPDGVRTLVAQIPPRSHRRRGARRGAGCRRPQSARIRAWRSLIDPGIEDAVRASRVGRRRSRAAGQIRLSANFVYVARLQPARHDRLQPGRARARRRAADPLDVDGRAGTSASVLQYTSFGETWYNGLTCSRRQAIQQPVSISRQLHAVEGGRQLHGFPERVHSAGQRPRPRSEQPERAADRVRSGQRTRAVAAGSATPSGAERNVRRAVRSERQLSAIVTVGVGPAIQHHCRRRPQWRRRRRHDTGTGPRRAPTWQTRPHRSGETAGHCRRRPPSTSASIRSCRSSGAPVSRQSSRCSTYSIAQTLRTSITCSDPAHTPRTRYLTFGQFLQAAPPRQAQVALKIEF